MTPAQPTEADLATAKRIVKMHALRGTVAKVYCGSLESHIAGALAEARESVHSSVQKADKCTPECTKPAAQVVRLPKRAGRPGMMCDKFQQGFNQAIDRIRALNPTVRFVEDEPK